MDIMNSKILYFNKWMSLYDAGGYVFSHETRCYNGIIIAVLIFDSSKPGQYFLRYEVCPAHNDGMALCSITGGAEDSNIHKLVIKEIKEEAGYDAKEEDLIVLGTVRPTKSTDTIVELYGWDCKGQPEPSKPEGDGSEGEKGAYCEWVSETKAIFCKDPLVATMILRMNQFKNKLDDLKVKNFK